MYPSPHHPIHPHILNIPAKNSQCYHKCISIHILVRLKFRLPLEPSLFWEKKINLHFKKKKIAFYQIKKNVPIPPPSHPPTHFKHTCQKQPMLPQVHLRTHLVRLKV
jgi:hypothetical protein